MDYPYLRGKVALVTGGSRGIGAATALLLAEHGADLVINYRSKAGRAEEVASEARAKGVRALPVPADITIKGDVQAMMDFIKREFGRVDIVVLNASGGLEKEMVAENPDYPMLLNRDAQVWTLEQAMTLMPQGGRAVFVTSHWAHFYGQVAQYSMYEPVARSKHAGEQALITLIPDLDKRGIRFVRVSGDLVEGTITPKLMERADAGMLEARRQAAGWLPTVDDMAVAIVRACGDDNLEQGGVIYVGETNVTRADGAKVAG
jgi:NAD(P)-dependent dehydrogenase (short-subunit alcohol dehydrogenase family)